jgi:Mob1/phocein family
MRASEWQYLCAVHDPPKSCCAIDYCCHTLDWATNILTSPKLFPSRMVLGGDNGNTAAAMRQLTNIFRRVYRIFAHAWFQHREVFWAVEANDGLYVFFKTVCDLYQLIPEDNYTIPPEAEGEREESEETPVNPSAPDLDTRMQLLKKDSLEASHVESNVNTTISVGATTRRHKHTPSTGSLVTTIAEGPEEEETESDATILLPSGSQSQVTHDQDLANGMKHMDLNKLPAFDGKAPHDPTPTAHSDGGNPFDDDTSGSPPKETVEPEPSKPAEEKDDLDSKIEKLESFADAPGNDESGDSTVLPEPEGNEDVVKLEEAEEKLGGNEKKANTETTAEETPAEVVEVV